jgi:hypothetical protein
MNGCKYCVIMHHRKRRGKRRARGTAMCLAQEELTRCHTKRHKRGPGCEFHDLKVLGVDRQRDKSAQAVTYVGQRRQRQASVPASPT